MSTLEKYGLNPKDWFCYGQWMQLPLSASFWVHWYDKKLAEKMGIKPLYGGLIMTNGYTIPYKKDLEIMKAQLRAAVENMEASFFEKFEEVTLEILEEHLKLVPLLKECKKADAELFNKFITSAKKVTAPWTLWVILSDDMGDLLIKIAEKHGISPNAIVDYIPKRETPMIKQHKEALEIKQALKEKGLLEPLKNSFENALVEIKKDKESWNKIESHLEEYDWVGLHHFWGETLNLDKFLEEIIELKELKTDERKEDLPEELEFAAKVSGDLGFLRQYAAEIFDLVSFKAKPLLENIAKQWGLSYEELLLLTPTEISKYLEQGTKPKKEDFIKRKDNYCIFLKGKEEIVIGDAEEVKAIIKEIVPQRDLSVEQFEGMVACKGHVKGTVKVFLVPEELEKMKDGDILVTTMTTPDFIPLMKKASAVVTDIGGLLSHAAIVSRELGIPCVIGTEIGTKVLKDNDLIEVDADKGIVKKIKK
jgi:phosphohistidine swiveling domain-containing protein/predicted DNA-binding protein YlxM (UPF0122 family)